MSTSPNERDPSKIRHHAKVVGGYAYAHQAGVLSAGEPAGRKEREVEQDRLMAPAATRARGAGRRAVHEEPDLLRTCFERDVDRIKHSAPFRRLAGKTQVMFAPDNDHVRTRLTHAVEVAQVAVSITRAARLNESLTEAVALAHDIGHGPAGHTAEDAFSPYLADGYDHALWGADVILAPLNLCEETVEGVRNSPWRRPAPATPEAEVVSWADRIAYLCHDLEDAYRAGVITPDQFPARFRDALGESRSEQVGTFVRAVVDGINATGHVCMTEPYGTLLGDFREFNYTNIYLRPESEAQRQKAIRLLQGLVEFYIDNPGMLAAEHWERWGHPEPGSEDAARGAVGYVAGMTDRFAVTAGVQHLGLSPADLPQPV